MKVSIVDYGAGNLPSVERAFALLGAETERVDTPEAVGSAKVIVLPGVGHFSAFVAGLRDRNLTEVLRTAARANVPVLGICLGLQALYASSEEAPGEKGLGLIGGQVVALPRDMKSPHIGWNQVRRERESALLRGLPDDAYFYFAHSYAAPETQGSTAAVCDHGFPFTAVMECGRLMGVQFHPEKSGSAGAKLLGNFLEAAR
ncbi:MAG: imidazole glycerol phosphate synthase subunit HisH [Candidatus Acidiferrales bacterium]